MTERDALLRAILQQPEEDTVRLAFADYCDEDGESDYAEFIRGQVRGERVRIGTNRFRQWFAPWWGFGQPFGLSHNRGATRAVVRDAVGYGGGVRVGPGPDCIVVSRGFVSEIHLPCAAFMQHAEAIFRAHPVTRVVLTDATPAVYTGNLRTVYFWADGTHTEYEPYCIDPSLWLMLDRRDTVPAIADSSARDGWETAAESHSHLSAACVAYGRSLAGLDQLTRTEVPA